MTLVFSLWDRPVAAQYAVFLVHTAYALGAAPCAQLAMLFDTGVLERLLSGGGPPNVTAGSLGYGHRDAAGVGDGLIYAAEEQTAPAHQRPAELLGVLDYIPRSMYPFDMAAVLTFICGAVFLGFFGSAVRSVPHDGGGDGGGGQPHHEKSRGTGPGCTDLAPGTVALKVLPAEEAEEPATQPTQEAVSGSTPVAAAVSSLPVDTCGRCFPRGACGVRGTLSFLIYFLLPMGVVSVLGSYHHLYVAALAGSRPLDPSALLLHTAFWLAIAAGRLVTPAAVRCITANGLTISCLTLSILSAALLGVYGAQYRVFLSIFTVLLGLAAGPLAPAGLTVCAVCVSPAPLGVAAAFILQAIGDGFFAWVSGYMLQYLQPEWLVYMALASMGAAFILYLPVIPVLARNKWDHLKRYRRNRSLKGKAVG